MNTKQLVEARARKLVGDWYCQIPPDVSVPGVYLEALAVAIAAAECDCARPSLDDEAAARELAATIVDRWRPFSEDKPGHREYAIEVISEPILTALTASRNGVIDQAIAALPEVEIAEGDELTDEVTYQLEYREKAVTALKALKD